MYNLQTFGIPTGIFPIDKNGKVLSDTYRIFLEKRKVRENRRKEKNQNPDTAEACIAVPSSRDVLLGRGRGFFNHVGNIRYRGIIEDLKDKYDASKRATKLEITKDVAQMIHESGGRFLKDDGAGWGVVDGDVARLKVSHSFRAARSGGETENKVTKNKPTADGGGESAETSDYPPRTKRTRAS
jgi:hypothetical protein